jgi:hypothetical protein
MSSPHEPHDASIGKPDNCRGLFHTYSDDDQQTSVDGADPGPPEPPRDPASQVPRTLRYASRYADLGYFPIPLQPRSKKPALLSWQSHPQLTEQEMYRRWGIRPDFNIGLVASKQSGVLFLDEDKQHGGSFERLEEELGIKLPAGPTARTPSGGRHKIFRRPANEDHLPPSVGELKDGVLHGISIGIDVRSDGGQIAVAPSIHPNGREYKWIVPPCAVSELPLAPPALIAAIKKSAGRKKKNAGAQDEPVDHTKEARNDTLLRVAAGLKGRGYSKVAARAEILDLNAKRYKDHPGTGKNDPGPLSEKEIDSTIFVTWDNWEDPTTWPAAKPVGQPMPKPDKFRLEMMPAALRDVTEDLSELMYTPAESVAACQMVVLAGSLGRRAFIRPKQHDTSWQAVANLYGMVVARPGSKKTPMLNEVTKALQIATDDFYKQFQEETETYHEELAAYQAAKDRNRKKKGSDGDDLPPRPEKPCEFCVLVQDATPEALVEVLANNPCGVLELHDEVTSLIAQFSKDGHEQDKSLRLTAWDGHSPWHERRKTRAHVRVPHACLSLFGGIQDEKLRGMLRNLVDNQFSNDGFLQRFQLAVWPDESVQFDLARVDRAPNAVARKRVSELLLKLIALPEGALDLRFDAEAQELFNAWWTDLEVNRIPSEPSPMMQEHLSKYNGLMPRLALIAEIADWADGHPSTGAVSLAHARQAVEWCRFLESHARKIYSCLIPDAARQTAELARLIRENGLGAEEPFTARDAYRSSRILNNRNIQGAIDDLVAHGWIRAIPSPVSTQGGHPTVRYEVNPAVKELPDAVSSDSLPVRRGRDFSDWQPSAEASRRVSEMSTLTFKQGLEQNRMAPSVPQQGELLTDDIPPAAPTPTDDAVPF